MMLPTATQGSPVVNNNGAPAYLAKIQGGIAWALDQYKQIETIKAIRKTPQMAIDENRYTDISQTNTSTSVAQPAITPEQRANAGNTVTVAGVTLSKPVLYATLAVLAALAAKKAGVF